MNITKICLFVILIIPVFSSAYAHTVDSVGEYRIEIGWMNEPVVSGETNGIELYISPLEPDIPLEDQEFKDGVKGLAKTVKIQLIYDSDKVTLPLRADHNLPGKYFAFVDPTAAGYYQANILGTIVDTPISLSMHPPKVENKTYLEFPSRQDQILVDHESFRGEIDEIKESLNRIESSNQNTSISYAAIGLGIAGIVIASIAISKRK